MVTGTELPGCKIFRLEQTFTTTLIFTKKITDKMRHTLAFILEVKIVSTNILRIKSETAEEVTEVFPVFAVRDPRRSELSDS